VVIEELLMNAIYDAPVDKDENSLYNNLDRKKKVTLEEGQNVKIRFAFDGLDLAISVEDLFGTFKNKTIIKYLENNYFKIDRDLNKNLGKGGAGKGVYMISENSDLVVNNVSKGTKTEAIVFFDLNPKKEESSKSLL
jgi:hypothetical protein